MKYEIRKIDNCFAQSHSFEYTLPITGEQMLAYLPEWSVRLNQKLRRPVGIAEKQGVIIKFILAGCQFRVSYPESSWQEEKHKFETFLESTACIE